MDLSRYFDYEQRGTAAAGDAARTVLFELGRILSLRLRAATDLAALVRR